MAKCLLVAVLGFCSWLALMPMTAWAQSSVDNEVYIACDDIKRVARQIMPAEDFTRLEGMSEETCRAYFSGYTRTELKSYLATKEYQMFWNNPVEEHTTVVYGTAGVDTIESLLATLEEDEAGATGQHYSEQYVDHQWDHAGRRINHVAVVFELEHYDDHYHGSPKGMATFAFSGAREFGLYVFYRNVVIWTTRSDLVDGGYKYLRVRARYEYQRCRENAPCSNPWRFHERSTKCDATRHRYSGKQCYIIDD